MLFFKLLLICGVVVIAFLSVLWWIMPPDDWADYE